MKRFNPRAIRVSMLVLVMAALVLSACGGAAPEAPAQSAATEEQSTSATAVTEAAPQEPASDADNSSERAGDREPAARAEMYDALPEMALDPAKVYYATIKTDKGDVKVQLFGDRAPVTVNNFVHLAREGYYDGTSFHRVLEDFMAQGGDPTGTGSGGPGYMFQDEIVPGLEFDRPNLLAMANAGPGTNGSQFFITFAPTPHLNGMHTIFGEVIEGADVLDKLTRRDPNEGPDFEGDKILSVEIEELETSVLPTPSPMPPTPTPYPPSSLDAKGRPLADVPLVERVNYFSAAPEMTLDTAKQYTATIETSKGTLVAELYDDIAPKAVNNFVTLADLGFFDGTPVNSVNPGTLLVIGSPDNVLPNDVGYQFVPEVNLPDAPKTGALAYAPLQPGPDGIEASGSVMFVALEAPPAEAGSQYGFFGSVVQGLDALQALTVTDTISSVTISVSE